MATTREKPSTKILRDARALLARRGGWIKGQYHLYAIDGRACYCALGALAAAAGHSSDYYGAHDRAVVVRLLQKVTGEQWIGGWNDKPSTRKKDVLAAFDKAIELSL